MSHDPKRIAIIGSGISGLSAAWLLSKEPEKFQVTVYESGDYIGGHTNTVKIKAIDGSNDTVGVDTGFIVCNPVTYPNFMNFVKELGVELRQSDMSFSISRISDGFEWASKNIDTVFAQRQNLIPIGNGLGVYLMIRDIFRFNKQAKRIAEEVDAILFDENGKAKEPAVDCQDLPYAPDSLADFFKRHKYSQFFYDNYILPITASIWSTPTDMAFDQFPLLTLVRFMRNHLLLQVGDRPKWRTVDGGSKNYVDKVLETLTDVRVNTPVVSVKRKTGGVVIKDGKGHQEEFDHVVFACHTDQIIKILGDDATKEEKKIIGSIKYNRNRALLHRDVSLMPECKRAWSSWNYKTKGSVDSKEDNVCITYWANHLQTFIDSKKFGDVFTTLNPVIEPKEETVLAEFMYEHPVYNNDTIRSQDLLNSIQNKKNTTFCGAWTNYGFHEDGVTSGLVAALSLGAKCPFPVILNGGYPTHREHPNPPKWAEKLGVKKYEKQPPLYKLKDRKLVRNGFSATFRVALAILFIAYLVWFYTK